MGESPRSTTSLTTKRTSNAVLLLAFTALDTTWRTLVPGLAGTIGGLLLDKMFHTTPVLMIIGLVLGVSISVVLIRLQFKALQK